MDAENLDGEERKSPRFADGMLKKKDSEESVMNADVEL